MSQEEFAALQEFLLIVLFPWITYGLGLLVGVGIVNAISLMFVRLGKSLSKPD